MRCRVSGTANKEIDLNRGDSVLEAGSRKSEAGREHGDGMCAAHNYNRK